jgi:hypothetical protein
MPLFERDSAGNRVPKAWDRPEPPKPFSRRVFDRPFTGGLAATAIGVALAFLVQPRWIGLALAFVAVAWLIGYSTREVCRAWHQYRWLSSAPSKPAPDDLIL